MRFRFSFVTVAVAILAAPAFAQDDAPAGEWEGVVVRNGVEASAALRLSESDDIWSGILRIDGASTPVDRVRVTDDNVHFELPDHAGVFDGTFASASMSGSVSGSDAPGSFALTLQPSAERQAFDDGYEGPIESQGP
jgi:hypothetical protein